MQLLTPAYVSDHGSFGNVHASRLSREAYILEYEAKCASICSALSNCL